MQTAPSLVETLAPSDVEWIFSAGKERRLSSDEVLIEAGQPVRSIFVVVRGLLGVFAGGDERRRLATVSSGQVVGEMSLLEERVPSETVQALEESFLVELPVEILRSELEGDEAFSARFHRGVARSLSARLRRANARLALADRPEEFEHRGSDAWVRLEPALDGFSERLRRADGAALRNQGVVPESIEVETQQAFDGLVRLIEATIGNEAPGSDRSKEEIGARLQQDLLPWILLTGVAERIWSKPRGNPVDFEVLEALIERRAGGTGRIGPLLDRSFLELPAVEARRGRRARIVEILRGVVESKQVGPAKITVLGCGPALELFDLFARVDPSRVEATVFDADPLALSGVRERATGLGLADRFHCVAENPLFTSMARRGAAAAGQDFVYSLYLGEQFGDEMVVRLLDWIYGTLASGGTVALGHLLPTDPCRAFFAHVLEWKPEYRDRERVDRLFVLSRFARPVRSWITEPTGISELAIAER